MATEKIFLASGMDDFISESIKWEELAAILSKCRPSTTERILDISEGQQFLQLILKIRMIKAGFKEQYAAPTIETRFEKCSP